MYVKSKSKIKLEYACMHREMYMNRCPWIIILHKYSTLLYIRDTKYLNLHLKKKNLSYYLSFQ